jgi:signal peptidase I
MSDPVMQNNSSSGSNPSSQPVSAGTHGSLILYTVIALGLALFIRFYVAAPYVVSGQSMEPNFDDWNYLIVDKVAYDVGTPQRGDIIVFNLPQDTNRALIKRIIGLPGETVVLSGGAITIINSQHPQGFTITEPYLDPKNLGGVNEMRMTLGADQYFVLGDNRHVSSDSRIWGALPRKDIVGRVLLRLYPFNEIGLLPAQARYSND